MFAGMRNIFKVTAGYNSTYHHGMGWVVEGDISFVWKHSYIYKSWGLSVCM